MRYCCHLLSLLARRPLCHCCARTPCCEASNAAGVLLAGSSSAGEDDGEDGGDSSCSSSDGSDGGDEPATLTELTPATTTPAVLARLSHGWTAYVVAVAAPSPAEGAADEQQLQWGPGV